MVLLSGRLTHPKWATLVPPAQSGAELKGEFDSNASDQGCPLSILPRDIQDSLTSGVDVGDNHNLRILGAQEEYRRELTARIGRECGLNLPG